MEYTYSKIFCYNNLLDLNEIYEYLLKENKEFQIITDNQYTVEFFKSKSFKVNHIDNFFPVYSNLMFQIYGNVKKEILKYKNLYENINFKEQNITMGLIHYITNDMLYIEKIKHILKKKDNVIFIFEKFHHRYFVINQIAKKNGFIIDEHINFVKNKKILKLKISENNSFLEKANIRSRYRKSLSLYSNNLINESNNKILQLIKISKKILPMTCKLIISKFYELIPEFSTKMIFKNIDNKIINIHPKHIFFLSSNRIDIFNPFYEIFRKYMDKKFDFSIITIDPITSSYLQKKGFKTIDLFTEVFTLSNILKKTNGHAMFEKNLMNIAIESNLDLLYLDRFNLELLDNIYRSISVSMIIEYVLKKTKSEKIILMEGTLLGMNVSCVAKKLNIHTNSIETLIVDDNAISSILYNADKIFIYGNQGQEILQNFGISKNRILVTGNPKYDYITSINTEKLKLVLKEKYQIDTSKKIITVAFSRWHESDERWMVKLIKFCNENNLEIVIKLHPRYKVDSQENSLRINYIKTECLKNKFHISFDIDLRMLLSSSDVVISDYSNVAVEAVLLGKIVINTNFIREDLTMAQNYHKFGGVLYTEEYVELEKLIKDIITDNKYSDILKKGREIMIEKYNFKNDGNALERIFNQLTSS